MIPTRAPSQAAPTRQPQTTRTTRQPPQDDTGGSSDRDRNPHAVPRQGDERTSRPRPGPPGRQDPRGAHRGPVEPDLRPGRGAGGGHRPDPEPGVPVQRGGPPAGPGHGHRQPLRGDHQRLQQHPRRRQVHGGSDPGRAPGHLRAHRQRLDEGLPRRHRQPLRQDQGDLSHCHRRHQRPDPAGAEDSRGLPGLPRGPEAVRGPGPGGPQDRRGQARRRQGRGGYGR